MLGASGYAGRELLKLLVAHPRAGVTLATSQSEAGAPLAKIARGAPVVDLRRIEEVDPGECDLVFSCLPHGESARWVERCRERGARVIDLSSDLRVPEKGFAGEGEEALYGLPELHRERLRGADLIANPGCYPTAALLALAPLLRRGWIRSGAVIIDAASGVTGAGRSPKRELLYAEVAEEYLAYAVGNRHRHLSEMRDQVRRHARGVEPELVFTPHLLPVRRGILETIYVPVVEAALEETLRPWREDFSGEPFVELVEDGMPTLGQVVGTNRVAIGATVASGTRDPLLIVIASIDNLLKGAAGQAVQNMNLMFGWEETMGLPC